MQDTQSQISDSLSAVLWEVEVAHIVDDDDAVDLSQNRLAVVKAAINYKVSRYRFGKALAAYRAVIPYSGWMPAVQAIADAIGVGERTVRNIVADYERTTPLAPQVISAMEDAGLDPAAKKHGKIISILRNEDVADPAEAVASAIVKLATAKVSYTIPGTLPVSKDERAVYKVRQAIRASLSNVPPNRKLEVLKTAIAEELYVLIGPSSGFKVAASVPTLDLMGLK